MSSCSDGDQRCEPCHGVKARQARGALTREMTTQLYSVKVTCGYVQHVLTLGLVILRTKGLTEDETAM